MANKDSYLQDELQRLQYGVEATFPHPRSTQHHGLVCSQTPSFTHTGLKVKETRTKMTQSISAFMFDCT